ncbi:Peptidase C26 [Thermus sp. CCB_US3_UF1]|uniref:peptidase C26 n=1 Tax=unclassified Thermus TaxID=2619321 RepID=UPI000238945D|nr:MULTISPECIES: peptidase C26 [unclassified Thermus]AEV16780.1 Peptidase C26 [Thermus sp. CCB_US3_UF1]MCS6868185.1 hypothetical protein [Thermus sp.]MCX7850232.1 hypothetical protein [Thermus sp.]MDW8017248.1 hypothetical protein [Thermus sp.]MDW8357584.1 hypothetical protein [Thermus sp.]
MSPERDTQEPFLARYAAEKGLQGRDVALGGSLYQDLEAQGFHEAQRYRKSPPHALAHGMRKEEALRALL